MDGEGPSVPGPHHDVPQGPGTGLPATVALQKTAQAGQVAKLRYYPLQETLLKPVYDVRAFSVRRRQVGFLGV